MQKNRKAKKSTLRKMAPVIVAAGIAGGAAIGYFMPTDFNGDGVYSQWETPASMALDGGSLYLITSFGIGIYEDHMKNKNKAKEKNKVEAYGHVKAV